MIVFMLKEILEERGWSRYKLQQKTKITYPTLHALYHQKNKKYSADVLNRLCIALRCQPGDLLKWKPDRFPRIKKGR